MTEHTGADEGADAAAAVTQGGDVQVEKDGDEQLAVERKWPMMGIDSSKT